ncbi:MAG: hypothetical protein ACRDGG_06535, partial [Anaerolineae bacterium]
MRNPQSATPQSAPQSGGQARAQAVDNRQSSEWRWVALAAIGVVLLSSLPYLAVGLTTPADLRFGGALVNPIDGQSYFAKMRQGYDGAWLFRLPFTATDDPDAFLFTYHIGLGHLARVIGLSLTAMYQLARVLGGWALLVTLYAWIARVFDSAADRRRAWLFVALTSGLGWIGIAASDVAIPESNTFFSILTNAHFAASTALMLILFMAALDGSWLRAALAAIGLAILQPFAPIATFAALGMFLLLRWVRQPSPPTPNPSPLSRRVVAERIGEGGGVAKPGRGVGGEDPLRQAIVAVVAGLSITPLMLYFFFAAQRDPILQGWAAQNLTPSPSPIEYLAGYGLMWLLAIPGARRALKRDRNVDLLLVAWVIASVLLLYAPFPLQRRFSLGLHIPIVLLAMLGLKSASVPSAAPLRGGSSRASHNWRKWLPEIAFIVSLPTTLLLLIATSSAAIRPPDPRLFFSAHES